MTGDKRTLETTETPTVIVEANENLVITGWDRPEVTAHTSIADTLNLTPEGDDTVRLVADSKCKANVPQGATVQIEALYGNGHFNSLRGELTILKIGGNLTLRDVGPSDVEKVYGNLTAREVNGDMRISDVFGNLVIRTLSGQLQVDELVKGNVVLKDLGGVQVSALGNATVTLVPQPDQRYEVDVRGNIRLRLPPDASAEVQITSQAQNIRIKLTDAHKTIRETTHTLRLGDGSAKIILKAKGGVHITSMGLEPGVETEGDAEVREQLDEITEEVNYLIDTQMATLEKQLNDQLSQLPDQVDTQALSANIDEIVEQARQYSTHAALRAQGKAQTAARRAQEKLTRKLEKARKRAERREKNASRWSRRPRRYSPHRRSRRTNWTEDSVTDEERLLILKMLEEKKISPEEAEQLLSALEGRDG